MRWCSLVLVVAACRGGVPRSDLVSAEHARALEARWQGTWVLPYTTGRSGPLDVLEVHGRDVTSWRGDAWQRGSLEIVAPCLVRLRIGAWASFQPFVFARDGLRTERGVGARVGDRWFACLGDDVVVVATATTCEVHRVGAAQTSRDATCTLDATQLAITLPDAGHALAIDGDTLLPAGDRGLPAHRAASLAEARTYAREHAIRR